MGGEGGGSGAAGGRLRGEVGDDRTAMSRRTRDLDEAQVRLDRTPGDPAALALAAWALHGWYTALETLLERIARHLDSDLPDGDRRHRELISQMVVEVPSLLPAVLHKAVRGNLVSLLAFRHFVRH